MKDFIKSLTMVLGVIMAVAACTQTKEKTDSAVESEADQITEPTELMHDKLESVTVQLLGKSQSNLKGEAIFTEMDSSEVKLEVTIEGVKPGQHAVHLHENGDCSAADASSAGGHWNPLDVGHGNRKTMGSHHKGDIGNLTVGQDGTGSMTLEIKGWTIGGPDSTNVLNKALIVHAGADDFISQPSGAAGDRIGCGVILSAEAGTN